MTTKSTNQIIHEAMGLCWHEWNGVLPDSDYCPVLSDSHRDYITSSCKKCGQHNMGNYPPLNPDYTSDWSAYGKALEWAQGKEWWADFAYELRAVSPAPIIMSAFLRDDLLIISEGSTAIAGFITEHPEYFKKEVKK